MTVDITQDEMNILNLNGISAEDVKANVEYSRANGLDDNAIRQQFSDTIEELKPITKVSPNDTAKIKEWQDKGAITPFEMGVRKAVLFNGTYGNIDDSVNLSAIERGLKNSSYNDKVDAKIQNAQIKKDERNQRVNNGTASFLDRVGAAMDRWGTASYNAQSNSFNDDVVVNKSGANKENSNTSKINFIESLGNSFMTGSWLPVVGGFLGSADTKKEREIEHKILNGEAIRQDELNFINHRIEQRQEESVRGYTLGGNIADSFLPSMIRFGLEIAAGGWVLKSLGLESALPTGATLGQKTLHGLGTMGKTGTVNTILPTGWNDIYEIYQDRMLNNEMQVTDKGDIIFQESAEKPATAFLKSLGQTFIMFASEGAGELIGIPVKGAGAAINKYAGTPISNYLKSNAVLKEFVKKITPELSKAYEKLNKLPIKGECVDWLKSKVKYDGFFEELGEEVLEDVLNLTVGTNNEERSLENYAKAIFKSPDEWAVLVGAVALQGGTLSVASHVLGSHLEKNGASDEQIVEVLQNLSEQDKEEMVHNLIEDGTINIDETDEEHFEKTINAVSERLLNSGKFTTKEKADKAARLGATMLNSLSEKVGKSFDDLVQNDMANIVENENSAYADENNKLHTSSEYEQQAINDRLNAMFDEYDNIPDDFDNAEELDTKAQDLGVLASIAENKQLSIEEMEQANDFVARLEENGDTEFAEIIKNRLNSTDDKVRFQRADIAGAEKSELVSAAKEWEEKGTESKYFKTWFGDSKVVDENGEPLIVYHGTNNNFEVFSRKFEGKANGRPVYGGGFNFTAYENFAKDFGDKQIVCYVSIKKPLNNETYKPEKFIEPVYKILYGENYKEYMKDGNKWTGYIEGKLQTFYGLRDLMQGLQYEKGLDVIELYKSLGYDGIQDGHIWVAFSPSQIKSVDNQGTFDSNNPNIYMQTDEDYSAQIQKNIQDTFGQSEEELTEMIKADIDNVIEDNDLRETEFKVVDVKLYGSYSTGKNNKKSDLDFLVEYEGTMREDDAFNMFADLKLKLETVNGKKVKVDINPIKAEKSGTISDFLERNKDYQKALKKTGYKVEPAISPDWREGTSRNQDELVFNNSINAQVENVKSNKSLNDKEIDNYLMINGYISGSKSANRKTFEIIKFFEQGGSLEESIVKYKENAYPKENHIEKIYKKYLENNTRKSVQTREIKLDYDGTDETFEYILGDYENNTSTDKIGHGYNNYSMSNNAVTAYSLGSKPMSKWNKKNIIESVERICKTYRIPLDSNKLKSLKLVELKSLLKEDGYHHTSKYFNATIFYKVDLEQIKEKGFIVESLVNKQPRVLFQSAMILGINPKQKVDVVDLTSQFSTDQNLTKKDLKKYITTLIANKFITTKDKKAIVKFIKKSKRIGKKDVYMPDHIVDSSMLERTYKGERNTFINNIVELIKHSVLIDNEPNTKKSVKPNVDNYLRFYVPVKINNDIFTVRISAENTNSKNLINILTADVYDVILDKKIPVSSPSTKGNLLKQVSNKSINHNAQNFNPNKITIEDMLKGVLDPKGNPYFTQKDTRQGKLFVDNEQSAKIENRFRKVKGTFIPAENLITLFKDADESTIVHELAHWYLEKLVEYSKDNEEIQEDLKAVRKFVKNQGEPFTDEQHERFARGFEAYMSTGSARNNRLKKLFEDFKNALMSLYDSIKNLGFDENELPAINSLFERLLTTENQRIRTAVFDKCNEIESQIQQIRDNQVQEFEDIETIERDNLERSARDNARYNQVKEYIRLAQKAVNRVPKSIKEYEQKFKNATFEILEVATGYKRQFIANPKNWELISDKINNVDDRITASGGMRNDWNEFYFDTGVDYDTQEVDGDFNLAQKAFDRMTSGNFKPADFEEEEIGKFFGMFDYLEGKVLSLRGENKSAAYEALTSIFNDIPKMPDDAMQELVDKLQSIGEAFIDQKAMERPTSKAIPNVSLPIQFRTYVTQKLHNMKSYDPEQKKIIRLSSVNKLYTLLKYANSAAATQNIIRTINNHAIEQLENKQKFILNKEIQRQVKINSKLMKVGALKKGKFDWKTNTVFKDLQQMNRLSIEDARKEYDKLIHLDTAVLGEERESIEQNPTSMLDAPTDFQKILKVKFLEYKSNKVKDLNLAATRSLLEDILELKFEGRRAKNEDELKKKLQKYNYETNLVSKVYRSLNNDKAQYVTRWIAGDTWFTSEGTLANWESLLNAIFDKETAEKYSLLKLESDVEVYAHKVCKQFYDKAMKIYGLNKQDNTVKGKLKDKFNRALDFDNTQPIIKLFQEYENTIYTFKQNTFNKDTGEFVATNLDLTHAQLITYYAWSLNPELKKRIIVQFVGEPDFNDYTEYEQILNEEMFSKLSEQDKRFAHAMIEVCDSMYNDTNEVFIRTTGLSLPRVENYIPSRTERIGSDLDMMHECCVRSTNPSFIKERKTCRRIKMESASPLEIILPHINKTARYIVMSETVNFYNKIFQSPDVKAAILDVYGKKSGTKIYRILLNQLATSTYENYARAITVGKSLMDTVASNYITSAIGGNAKVFLSQLTSVINYSENMPPQQWAKGFVEALKNPKETIKFMFDNCEYLKTRLAGNSQNEIIAQLTNESDKLRSLRNFGTANTKYGDILAIIFGGKPYVDYLLKNGTVKEKEVVEENGVKIEKTKERKMTKEEVFQQFVESTLRSQQSGHNSATSAWQKSVSQNALTRMIFAFNNTNMQYERKMLDAISSYAKVDITKRELAKAFVIYKVFNPILFSSFLTNLSIMTFVQNMFGGGDDEPFQSLGADIIASIVLSNWRAYGMIGILANSLISAVAAMAFDGKFFENSIPLISDFESSIKKLLGKKELEFSDYAEMLVVAGDYSTGVPATRTYNTLGGMYDITQGELGKGFLRIIGYGNYRASVAATGEEPKRKR